VLQPFGENIWLADGPITDVMGFRYPTRMAVIKLVDGTLFVWSPIAITEPLKAAIDAVGAVRFIVAPNSLHNRFVQEWQAAYPYAQLHGAPGLSKRCPHISIDAVLTDIAPPEWAGQIDQIVVGGNAITTEVVFFHRASGTAIFTDLIQGFKPGWFTGWRAILAKLDLLTAPEPSVPRKFRAAFTNRALARAAIARILAWPVEKVVMAHGPPIMADASSFLRRAFVWLRPQSRQ
jgi:hypothetical protein